MNVIHKGADGTDIESKPKKLKSKPVDRCPKCRGKLIFGTGWPPGDAEASNITHKHQYRACEQCPYFVEVFIK